MVKLVAVSSFSSVTYCLIILCTVEVTLSKDEVQMRLVEEPVNMGQWNNNVDTNTDVLTPKIKPSNFSGPPHLKQLMGKCYTVVEKSYKYELCPFNNVTQHEQSERWNPYSGILGNWYEWVIENNTFVGMAYKHGDDCGSKSRQVTVTLQCGTKTAIVAVSEPETCCYAMNLSTPLVCHPHSLLVYPTLTKPLQEQWDILEGRLYREEITKQGYNKMLHKVFEEAGLVRDPNSQPKTLSPPLTGQQTFIDVDVCQTAYNNLLQEVERLRGLVNVDDIDAQAHNDDTEDGDYEPSLDFRNYEGEDDYNNKHPMLDDPFLDA